MKQLRISFALHADLGALLQYFCTVLPLFHFDNMAECKRVVVSILQKNVPLSSQSRVGMMLKQSLSILQSDSKPAIHSCLFFLNYTLHRVRTLTHYPEDIARPLTNTLLTLIRSPSVSLLDAEIFGDALSCLYFFRNSAFLHATLLAAPYHMLLLGGMERFAALLDDSTERADAWTTTLNGVASGLLLLAEMLYDDPPTGSSVCERGA